MEQLAWLLGYTKARMEYLRWTIRDYGVYGNELIASDVAAAMERGNSEFNPDIPPMQACPYKGQQYVLAYAEGWLKARSTWEKNRAKS